MWSSCRCSSESGQKVATVFAGSTDIMKRIEAGEAFDLIIMPRAFIDDLTRSGKIAAGSRVDLAKSGIGVAVRAGAPIPDISSGEALKRVLLAARSIAYSSSASGIYLADLFQRMGIADALKARIKQSPPGTPVGELIARGEAEVGFQQVSELLPIGALTSSVPYHRTFSTSPYSPAACTSAPRRRRRRRR